MNKTYGGVTEEGINKAIKAGLIDLVAIDHIFDGLDKIHAPNTFNRINTIQYLLSIQSPDIKQLIDLMFVLDGGIILAKPEQIEGLNHSITEALLGSGACQTIGSYRSQKLFTDKINTLCAPYRLIDITSMHENVFENIYFHFHFSSVEHKIGIRPCRYFKMQRSISEYHICCSTSVELKLPECGRLDLLCAEFKKILDSGVNI